MVGDAQAGGSPELVGGSGDLNVRHARGFTSLNSIRYKILPTAHIHTRARRMLWMTVGFWPLMMTEIFSI